MDDGTSQPLPPDAAQPDLGLVETKILIEELVQRFCHFVMIGMQMRSPMEYYICRRYAGNHHACIGMLAEMEDYIMDEIREATEQQEENE